MGRLDDKIAIVTGAGQGIGRAIAVNLYGVLHTCKAVLPVMAGQGHGAMVNLGSDAGRVGSSGEAVYSAAKGLTMS